MTTNLSQDIIQIKIKLQPASIKGNEYCVTLSYEWHICMPVQIMTISTFEIELELIYFSSELLFAVNFSTINHFHV